MARIMERLGHKIYYFAGELEDDDADLGRLDVTISGRMLAPLAHFTHPDIQWVTSHAFGKVTTPRKFRIEIEEMAARLKKKLVEFINEFHIDVLVAENIFAIPMNLPLSMAMRRVIVEHNIPCLSHDHDFYWERDRYAITSVDDILMSTFPPNLPGITHAVINTQAQRALAERGVESHYLPNIFDYATPPDGIDNYNADLRKELGIKPGELFFLQPTRVVHRKKIERAIELIARLSDLPIKLYITHHAEYDTLDYLGDLFALAARQRVQLNYIPNRFAPMRTPGEGIRKVYSLWDAYIHADFVTYPSGYEGFGNALLETLYFRKPLLVNRYQVYKDDLEPLGIKAVTIDDEITKDTEQEVRDLLANRTMVAAQTEHNYRIAQEHFSYEAVEPLLKQILESL